MRLAAIVSRAQLLRHGLGRRIRLRQDDDLGSARDPGHEGDVTALASHHLDEKRPPVGGGGGLETIDRFEGNVQGGVDTDRDLRAD